MSEEARARDVIADALFDSDFDLDTNDVIADAILAGIAKEELVIVDRERFERLQRMALKAKEMGRTTVGLQDSDFEPLPERTPEGVNG